ncbi:HK97 gp10 family phage protein [Clostridium botulinum]|nr:HK97 gp10 family phage protein [Clostridium botulinum]
MQSFEDIIKEAENMIKKTDRIIREEMEEKQTMCVAEIQARTPVKDGHLKRSMTHTGVKKTGDNYKGEVGSDTERLVADSGSKLNYAKKIENGYVTSKGKLVLGRHMIRDSIDIYQEELEKSVEERIEKEVWNEL